MRKLFFILLLIPFFVDAQVWQQNNLEYGHQFKGLKPTRVLILPLIQATAGQGRDTGAIRYALADSSVYVWTGYQWRQLGAGSGGGSGTVTSFSFTNSTGITGTVTNPTTTPTLSLVIDTGAISGFHSKVKSLFSAGAGLSYANGVYTNTGMLSLNGLTGSTQTFATGTSGTDFNISSASTTHTFNLPTASGTNRGALSSADWTTFNNKLSNITGLVTQGWNIKLTGSGTSGTPYVINVDTTTQTLTDGATITFDANAGVSARVTLGGNRTLAFSNFRNGMFLSLLIIQDGTGGRTITLPTSRVINGGAGAVTLTTAASSQDILTFWKINDVIYCNYGKNYN